MRSRLLAMNDFPHSAQLRSVGCPSGIRERLTRRLPARRLHVSEQNFRGAPVAGWAIGPPHSAHVVGRVANFLSRAVLAPCEPLQLWEQNCCCEVVRATSKDDPHHLHDRVSISPVYHWFYGNTWSQVFWSRRNALSTMLSAPTRTQAYRPRWPVGRLFVVSTRCGTSSTFMPARCATR